MTKILLTDLWRALQRILPGLVVLIIVLVLLRGVSGTADALWLQVTTLFASFLGAGDGLAGVLVHTMPLAIAAAIATFAVKSRMLTFESPWSFVGLACIIIAGTSIGGLLRGFVPDSPTAKVTTEGSLPVANAVDRQQSLRLSTVPGESWIVAAPALELPVPPPPVSPLERLRSIDWLAEPNLKQAPPRKIAPLNLLPETGGAPGAVLKAVNLILGYLVAYQPRLFLAAIVAGCWVGWTVHRRLSLLNDRLATEGSAAEAVEFRKAA